MRLVAIPLSAVTEVLRQSIVSDKSKEMGVKATRQKIRQQFSDIVSEQVSFGPNQDMFNYLKNDAITTEWTHRSRNFIIIDEEVSDEVFEILGFFTLTLKIINVLELDDKTRKSFALSGKNASKLDYLPGILIAQFGKNLTFNKINGHQVMELVMEKIQQAQEILGGKMVYLDSVNEEAVIRFYERFGFVKYGDLIQDRSHPKYSINRWH